MENKIRLKVYTKEHGRFNSKALLSEEEIPFLLSELSIVATITTAYLTNGKMSKQINFTIKNQSTRPIYYTRSDGLRVYSLSILPQNYPMTAYYSDGHTALISLNKGYKKT